MVAVVSHAGKILFTVNLEQEEPTKSHLAPPKMEGEAESMSVQDCEIDDTYGENIRTSVCVKTMGRERFQRINRDAFRRRVMKLVDRWIGLLKNGEELKQTVVTNDDQGKQKNHEKPPKRGPMKKNKNVDVESVRGSGGADETFRQQNGYFYYNVLCTNEMEALLAKKRPKGPGESEIEVLVDRLAFLANIYIKLMYTSGVRPTVFIKFDDREIPTLFARQTTPTPDTWITGSPGFYWTKILHFDNIVKPVQRVPLQRVRSERLLQDSTFVVVGAGSLDQLTTVIPDQFSASSNARRCFKEMYEYIASLPEVDVSRLGWDRRVGVADPIKSFLPRIIAADSLSGDDGIFINYMDMFVTMVALRLKNEGLAALCGIEAACSKPPRVLRTEYKTEIAGKADDRGLYFFRNRCDFITDISPLAMIDDLMEVDEIESRIRSYDEGVYFYDVQSVNEIIVKLESNGMSYVQPELYGFYTYVLAVNDEVRRTIAASAHTIDYRVEDALIEGKLFKLHATDPARSEHAVWATKPDDIFVTTDMSQYKTTFYVEKGKKLLRVLKGFPENLHRSDCILRVFKLKWRGKDCEGGNSFYTMFPQFCFVFKNLSVYEEIEAVGGFNNDSTEYIFPDPRYKLDGSPLVAAPMEIQGETVLAEKPAAKDIRNLIKSFNPLSDD